MSSSVRADAGTGVGVQVAQRRRLSLAVAVAFEDRHVAVGVAEVLFELRVPGGPPGTTLWVRAPVGRRARTVRRSLLTGLQGDVPQ
jgi:hypothetical protein